MFGQKAIWVKTNFGTEKLLCPKKTMGLKKMSGPKKSYVQKIFGFDIYEAYVNLVFGFPLHRGWG